MSYFTKKVEEENQWFLDEVLIPNIVRAFFPIAVLIIHGLLIYFLGEDPILQWIIHNMPGFILAFCGLFLAGWMYFTCQGIAGLLYYLEPAFVIPKFLWFLVFLIIMLNT